MRARASSGNMFQVVLERGDEPLGHVAPGFFFAHGAERVHDGHINVVVFTACFYGGFRDVQNFLVASRGEQGAAEQVIGALAVALAVDSLFDHAHGFIMEFGGVEDPGLADLHFGQVPAQGHGPAGSLPRAFDPHLIAAEGRVVHGAGVGAGGVGQGEA